MRRSTTSRTRRRGVWTCDHLEVGASHIHMRVESAPIERLLRLSCDGNRTRDWNCKLYRGIEQEDNRFRGTFPSAFYCSGNGKSTNKKASKPETWETSISGLTPGEKQIGISRGVRRGRKQQDSRKGTGRWRGRRRARFAKARALVLQQNFKGYFFASYQGIIFEDRHQGKSLLNEEAQ